MDVTFGDFFISQGIVYRTFTNYHESDGFYGHPLYSVEDKTLKKLKSNKKNFVFIPKENIQEMFISRMPQHISNEGLNFVLNQLEFLGVKDVRITGAELLKDYGFIKEKESKLSDIDLLVCGRKNVDVLKEVYTQLYNGKYSAYYENDDLLNQLLFRRKYKSNIDMDFHTVACFESRKPIGNYSGIHINITPSYIIFDYKQEVLEDYGFRTVNGVITGDKNAFCLPGYYDVSCYEYPEVRKLKSNMFFFLIGLNHIGSNFSTKARLLKVQSLDGDECVLEIHTKWSTQLSLKVWKK